tara:strand:+ start:4076 stop:4261 length:186 start_codon:yes stop_codon:yes gene_type:complete
MGNDMNTQGQRQSAMNKALNDCLREFIAEHPDTDAQTMLDAMDDSKSDALELWIKNSPATS